MQQPESANEFLRNFSDICIIKPNSYLTLVEFVPTTFNPAAKEDLQAVELANALQPGDITIVQWIKPPEK